MTEDESKMIYTDGVFSTHQTHEYMQQRKVQTMIYIKGSKFDITG